jgi:hypothetical protein
MATLVDGYQRFSYIPARTTPYSLLPTLQVTDHIVERPSYYALPCPVEEKTSSILGRLVIRNLISAHGSRIHMRAMFLVYS